MYFQSKAARRFSILRNPAGIVIGYILTLFAIVAGAAAFPFSKFWMALLFVVVGTFFLVGISLIVMSYLFFMWRFFTASRGFARRLLFGADQSQATSKPSLLRKDLEPQAINAELWDRWIDGSLPNQA
jgi:hypothetical protein